MLDRLCELGFIELENGRLSEEDATILLHIYNNKLKGANVNLTKEAVKLGFGKNLKLLPKMAEIFYQKNLEQGFEATHQLFGIQEGKNFESENIKMARSYDNFCEMAMRLSNVLKSKRKDHIAIKSVLEDADKFDDYYAILNNKISPKSFVEALEKQEELLHDDLIDAKIKTFPFAVDFATRSDLREGKMTALEK